MSRIGIIIGTTRDNSAGKVVGSGSMISPRGARMGWSTPCWISRSLMFRC